MRIAVVKIVFMLFITTSLAFTTKKEQLIDPIKVLATYQGYNENGYTFSFMNEDDNEEMITFETVSENLLKVYNLNDNKFIDQEFEITYDYETSEEDDEIEIPVLQSIKKIE